MLNLFQRNLYSLIITCIVCAGCHQSHQNLLGTWRGFYNNPYSSETDPSIAYTLNKVELQLEPYSKFTFTQYGLLYTGEYHLSSNTITLKLRTLMGRPLERALLPSVNHPKTFQIKSKDNQLIFYPDESSQIMLSKINPKKVK